MSGQAGDAAGKVAAPVPGGTPEGRIIFSLRDVLSVFGRVLPYARRHWTSFLLGVIATVILNAASVVQPYILKVLTDEVLAKPGGDLHVLHMSLLLLLATAAIKGAFIYVQAYTLGWGTNATVRDIREDVYRHLQRLPLTWFDRQRLGDVIQRLTDDVRIMTELLARNLIVLMNDLLVSVSAIVYMVTQSPLMTALAFGLTPVTVSMIKRFDRRLEGDIAAVTEQTARRVTRVQEVLGAIRLVKLLGREHDEAARDGQAGDALYRRSLDIARVGQMENPMVESISTVSLVIVIGYGAYEVGAHAMTLGEFMAYWGYLLLASTPVTRLTQTLGAMRRGLVSADRVFMLKDIAPEPVDAPDAAPLPPVSREIVFEHVHFGYRKGAPVLEDVHLTLPYGQVVAIVGPNGAGKSTLLSLLSRFHDPASGSVRIDGHDLRAVQRKSLREQIGYVLQDNVLFSGTIRSNLTYGCPDATDAQIEQAARAAFCHDVIEALPQGYLTPVVEGGRGLSGGQRQRIAIARALLADPRILILDEATSALDPHAEREVQRAQEPLLRGRSTFVIAHRLSTVRRADLILVMERGRVVEQGTHDALMARSGLYRRLYDAFRGETAEEAYASMAPEPSEVGNATDLQGGEGGAA